MGEEHILNEEGMWGVTAEFKSEGLYLVEEISDAADNDIMLKEDEQRNLYELLTGRFGEPDAESEDFESSKDRIVTSADATERFEDIEERLSEIEDITAIKRLKGL